MEANRAEDEEGEPGREAPAARAIELPGRLSATQRASIASIRLYQRRLSRRLARTCMYEPSCSQYALLAVAYQGTLRGWTSAARRIARCRPKYEGTIDYPKGVPLVPD